MELNKWSKKLQQPDYQTDKKSVLDTSHMTRDQSLYFQSNYACEEHPNEPITNYCSSLDCLKPLCPECIDQHYKLHLQQNTLPEIESIKNVKNNCSKKLKAAIISLTSEMEKAEMQYLINPESIIDEGQIKIKKCKEKIQQVINQFFDVIEDQFKKKVHENILKATDFNLVFDKIRALIQELELLNSNLDSGSTISVIKRICLLDLKSLMDKYRSEIHKVIDSRDLDPVGIQIEEQRINLLKSELEKIVQVIKIQSEYHEGHEIPMLNQFQQKEFQLNNPTPQRSQNQSQYQQILQVPNQILQQGSQRSLVGQINSSSNLNLGQNLIIKQVDYYEQASQKKFLHFFLNEEKSSKLFYFNLLDKQQLQSQEGCKFIIQDIDINFQMPVFHKSISLPNGDIFMIGGRNKDGQKSNDIYKYDFINMTLIPVAKMQVPRSSHGLCYAQNKIYIVGGFTNNQHMTNTCEVFDPDTNTCSLKNNLNYPASSLCLSQFNNQFIFKFGGIGENRQLSLFIEKFNIEINKWTVIDPRIQPSEKSASFSLLSTACCLQINPDEILIFGGYTEQNIGSSLSYVLQVEDVEKDIYIIKCINQKPLPVAEGFWNNQALIHEGQVYALQNVPCANSNNCLENDRKILQFNGKEWNILNMLENE